MLKACLTDCSLGRLYDSTISYWFLIIAYSLIHIKLGALHMHAMAGTCKSELQNDLEVILPITKGRQLLIIFWSEDVILNAINFTKWPLLHFIHSTYLSQRHKYCEVKATFHNHINHIRLTINFNRVDFLKFQKLISCECSLQCYSNFCPFMDPILLWLFYNPFKRCCHHRDQHVEQQNRHQDHKYHKYSDCHGRCPRQVKLLILEEKETLFTCISIQGYSCTYNVLKCNMNTDREWVNIGDDIFKSDSKIFRTRNTEFKSTSDTTPR